MTGTEIYRVPMPVSNAGNDPNDNREDEDYLQHVEEELPIAQDTAAPPAPLGGAQKLDIRTILNSSPPERKFLLKDEHGSGVIPAGVGCGVAGPGGSGKSLVCAELCFAVAVGGRWLGRYQSHVRQRVFLLSAEDGRHEFHSRIRTIRETYIRESGADAERVAEIDRLLEENLIIYPLVGTPIQLTKADGRGGFERGQAAADVLDLINTEDCDSLVVFDPLRKLTAGNEDGAAMNAVVTTCDWIRKNAHGVCTTLVIHHSSQSSQEKADDTQNAFRGATDLVDGLRWTMVMQKLLASQVKSQKLLITEKDRVNYRGYSFPKSNYTAEQYGMFMEYRNGVFRHSSLKTSSNLKAEQKSDAAKPILCKVLAYLESLGDPVSEKMLRVYCKASPTGAEVGDLIPIGKHQPAVQILLSEAKQEGLVQLSQRTFKNKKLGEAWSLTDAGRALAEDSK